MEKTEKGWHKEQYCGMRDGRPLMRIHCVTDKWISWLLHGTVRKAKENIGRRENATSQEGLRANEKWGKKGERKI